LSRGQEAAKQILGGFAGFLGSDRCECYSWVDVEKRQLCWSHLLRDFQGWYRVKDGKMSKEQFREAVKLLRVGIRQELELTADMELGKGEKHHMPKR
jgi:transposase